MKAKYFVRYYLDGYPHDESSLAVDIIYETYWSAEQVLELIESTIVNKLFCRSHELVITGIFKL